MRHLLFLIFVGLIIIPMVNIHGKTRVIFTHLVLSDVQGLFGGRNIYINREGVVWIQKISDNRTETRTTFTLTQAELIEIKMLVATSNNLQFKTKDRLGVPDEGQPFLIARLSTGRINKVGKWANDEHPDFDRVYHWLITKMNSAPPSEVLYTGPYQMDWSPPEFKEQVFDPMIRQEK